MLEFNATFIVAIISFAVFIVIMNAIFYRPILEIIKKRDDYINSNYFDTEKNESETKYQKTNYSNSLTETQQKCIKDYINAKEQTHNFALENLKKARIEAKAEITSNKQSLIAQENQLMKTLEENSIDDIAMSITSKIMGK